MDLEPLPPEPVDPAAPWAAPTETWAAPSGGAGPTPTPRPRWSARARIAAAIGAVSVSGAAAFGIGQLTAGGGVHLGALAAASGPSSSTPSQKTVHRGAAYGTVSNLNGPDFTVTRTAAGTTSTTNVITNASTTFTKTIKGPVSDIKVNDRIAAEGTRSSDGSLAATRIQIAPASSNQSQKPPTRPAPPAGAPTPPPNNRPFTAGVVQSISNGVITITTPRGTDKITTNASTVVVETVPAHLSDVTNGATVAVAGTPTTDDKALTANRVDIIDPSLATQGGRFGFGRGVGPGGPFVAPGPGGFGHGGGRHMGPGGFHKMPGTPAAPSPAQ